MTVIPMESSVFYSLAEPSLTSNLKRYSLYDDVKLSWDTAESVCENKGGKLAKISDENIHNHISKLIQSEGVKDPRYWFNAVKDTEMSDWSTKDGKSLTWFHWETDQTRGNNRRCAKIR